MSVTKRKDFYWCTHLPRLLIHLIVIAVCHDDSESRISHRCRHRYILCYTVASWFWRLRHSSQNTGRFLAGRLSYLWSIGHQLVPMKNSSPCWQIAPYKGEGTKPTNSSFYLWFFRMWFRGYQKIPNHKKLPGNGRFRTRPGSS